MVAVLASRQLGRPVNRKRVQRVMRAHRLLQPTRSGDRDPESRPSSNSGSDSSRNAWPRSQWGSLDQARKQISGYIDGYQHRPHSRLAHLTPTEVAASWRRDPDMLQTPAT